jgi:hypothetical protein
LQDIFVALQQFRGFFLKSAEVIAATQCADGRVLLGSVCFATPRGASLSDGEIRDAS